MKQEFFQVKTVAECERILQSFPAVTGQEEIDFHMGQDRIVAHEVKAPEDLPPCARSSMDGYAVVARDVFGASEANPAYLSLRADLAVDASPEWTLRPGECAGILTGGCLPPGADAVVMVEHTQLLGDDEVEVFKAVSPGDNLMLAGEDCGQGEVVLSAGSRIRPQEIGLLAALGVQKISVRAQPKVAIISTGDELVEVQTEPGPGQIRDVNSSTLEAWCRQAGGKPIPLGIIPDTLQDLNRAMHLALEKADCVLISGGSSVGTRDLTVDVIQSLPQGRILVHGIALSPGKPTIIAAQDRIPILGLPGQVTSAQVVMRVLGMPFIGHLGGYSRAFDPALRPRVRAVVTRNISSQPGREDYVRVKLHQTQSGELQAEPVLAKSGLLRSLLQADGLLRIPADSEGVLQSERHDVWL